MKKKLLCRHGMRAWPGLKPYIEIEAADRAGVENCARNLGFDPALGVAGGVEFVYALEAGIPAKELLSRTHITFAEPPIRKP